jgi:integrase
VRASSGARRAAWLRRSLKMRWTRSPNAGAGSRGRFRRCVSKALRTPRRASAGFARAPAQSHERFQRCLLISARDMRGAPAKTNRKTPTVRRKSAAGLKLNTWRSARWGCSESIAPNLPVLVHACLDWYERSNEARTLRWSQVDLGESGEIRVGGSKTEAGKGRRIPMSGNLRAVLLQHGPGYESQLGPVQLLRSKIR